MKTNILIISALMTVLSAPLAMAASYDLKEVTPEVQQALNNRKQRYEQLQQLKSSGAVGENTQGHVAALKSTAAQIVSDENQDRRTIYNAIVQQNNLAPGSLAQVQQAFAEVQREKARPGDFIQDPSGNWKQK